MLKILYICASILICVHAQSLITKDLKEPKDLEDLTVDLLNGVTRRHDVTCVTIICDTVYLNVFEGDFFKRTLSVPFIMDGRNKLHAAVVSRIFKVVVDDYEDLLSPNFNTLESLREARRDGCNVYVILLANGLQASRLLRFGDRHRILETRAKYIMLHDFRLFHSDLHYLWKRIVNVIFMRYHKKTAKSAPWFDISTVPFPNPIKGIFVSKRLDIWKNGKFHYSRPLFADKTTDFNGEVLNVVYLDHVPSVMVLKTNDSEKISGIEIEILNTLAQKMNFKPKLYQPDNAYLHKWGQKLANGSFSGLLGEMTNGKADIACGNLQYNPYHLALVDLSIPYTSQCWTFLTPEALTDNSWKTLILPFKLYMWVTVILVLLITGSIFYGLAKFYINLLEYRDKKLANGKNVAKHENKYSGAKPVGLYLFGEIINSILYTYGMLLVVSLPKLPSGWSIRLLTGWYWLYCILLVVSYRASMTAILANPAPRVTIDTLKELVDSKITCGGWGSETQRFFQESLDDVGQMIGKGFENINDPELAATKVAQGVYAYYENKHFLKYLSVKRKSAYIDVETDNSTRSDNSTTNNTAALAKSDGGRSLHIMSDCVINIPISIGFHKNSPMKPLTDIYLRRIVEVGLIEKWLNDAMQPIRALDVKEENVKALMNLKKLYGAFVALAIGYFLSSICLTGEFIHWYLIVKRDPDFDKYALDVYYTNKKK